MLGINNFIHKLSDPDGFLMCLTGPLGLLLFLSSNEHCFDFNAPDALGHSCIKRYMRSRRVPRNTDQLVRDFNLAVKHGLTDRAIQRSFMRAYAKNAEGDTDLSLIPKDIQDWYSDSDFSDEEQSSDLETDEMGFLV